MKVKEVNEELGVIGSMLRADAPVFEPGWRYEWNEGSGTLEDGPDESSEGNPPWELRARKTRTWLAEHESRNMSEGKGQEGQGSEVVQAEDLRQEQRRDGDLKIVMEWLEDEEKEPEASELRTHSPEVQQFWAQRPCLAV